MGNRIIDKQWDRNYFSRMVEEDVENLMNITIIQSWEKSLFLAYEKSYFKFLAF